MKKYNVVLSLILACALMLGLCLSADAATKQYTSDWVYWSQGASGIGGKMNSSGCRVVAAAKMLKEMGIADNSFDPDIYANWAYERGFYGKVSRGGLSDYIGEQAPMGTAPVVYANERGKSITYHGEKKLPSSKEEQDKKIMEWLNAGYYVIAGSPGHQAYVARAISLEKGNAYLANSSGRSAKTKSECKTWCLQKFTSRKGYTYVRLYTLDDGTVPLATVTFSNYQVRKLGDTSAEPYATVNSTGAKVTEVGMYIGLSKGDLVKLGSDNGKAGYKKNMWYNTAKYGYPLEPGTTYYYQPYAVVGGEPNWGEVKSFTTTGDKPAKTDEPMACSHSYNSGGYCKKCGQEYPMTVMCLTSPATYETAKSDVPLRERPYASDKIVKSLPKGEKVTVVESGENSLGNLWYKLNDGTWVYSENLQKVEQSTQPVTCNGNHIKGEYQFSEDLHPHEKYWKCANCGVLFTDGSTEKLDSCEICNPKSTPEPITLPTRSPENTYTALVTCNADVLNIRKGPGTSYDKVGNVARGSQCTVYPDRTENGWCWVESNGVTGYAAGNKLTKFTGNTCTGVVTCNADVLNVRKGPGTSYDKVGQIPNGASCTVYLDVKADWYFVTYGDIAGYASKNKITLR